MTLRGLFPSLGAGGSLIAAAACAFAVLGGALAFRGESPGTAEANDGAVVVPGRTVRAKTSSPGVVDTVVALAQSGQQAARSAPPQRRRQTVASVRRGGTRTVPPTGVSPSVPAPGDALSPGGRVTAPGATPAPPAPEAPTAPKPPELPSVQHTVEQTRGAVQPVVDTVPEPVQAPVERVADTVEEVAGTVDETVDGLTGSLLPPG